MGQLMHADWKWVIFINIRVMLIMQKLYDLFSNKQFGDIVLQE